MEGQKQKILLCGDVEGKFKTLFDRVATVNQKSGPFDCLFCVGNFFGINNKEFELYKRGEKKVPIPTYILGPNDPEHVNLYLDNSFGEGELCPNVNWLGKRGVYTDSKGLKIAYMSGIGAEESSDFEFSKEDITQLYGSCIRGDPSYRGVDILLTSQWPSNVMNHAPKQVKLTVNKTSDLPSWLAMKVKPRYHISGLEGVYYERAPFRVPQLSEHDVGLDFATRFLGLARVGNPNKEKWLYALSVTPLDKMNIGALLQKTTDETACPYNFEELNEKLYNVKKRPHGLSINPYFYGTSEPEEQSRDYRKNKRQKIEFDQSKCWFCLASPSVEKHLIITVANSTYLALAKGGMVEEHFLICPIEHYQCSLGQPPEVIEEIKQFKEAIRKFYARRGQVAVFFERNFKTSHMQLQAVPVPKKATKELKKLFMDMAVSENVDLQLLSTDNRLDQVLRPQSLYFTVELPDGATLYSPIKTFFPLNFGRKVLATDCILDCSHKVDWKTCILDKEAEESLVQRIRTDFEPFDFTND